MLQMSRFITLILFCVAIASCGEDSVSIESIVDSVSATDPADDPSVDNSASDDTNDDAPIGDDSNDDAPTGDSGNGDSGNEISAEEAAAIAASIERGGDAYSAQCAVCHANDGSGVFPIGPPIDLLAVEYTETATGETYSAVEYTVLTMPIGNASGCEGQCAEDVVAYMRFLGGDDGGSGPAGSGGDGGNGGGNNDSGDGGGNNDNGNDDANNDNGNDDGNNDNGNDDGNNDNGNDDADNDDDTNNDDADNDNENDDANNDDDTNNDDADNDNGNDDANNDDGNDDTADDDQAGDDDTGDQGDDANDDNNDSPPVRVFTDVIAINIGGQQYTTADGVVYMADNGSYTTDSRVANPFFTPVDGTNDDPLYQTERFARDGQTFSLNIPLDSGTYRITLQFAEVFFASPNTRLFDVTLEGEAVLQSVDLYALHNQTFFAVDYIYDDVLIDDGELNVRLDSVRENAQIGAIRVERVTESQGGNDGGSGEDDDGNDDENNDNGNNDNGNDDNGNNDNGNDDANNDNGNDDANNDDGNDDANNDDGNDNGEAQEIAASIQRGEDIWDAQCLICHAEDGSGNPAFANVPPIDLLATEYTLAGNTYPAVQYTDMTMPFGAAGNCTGQCAEDVVAYMRFLGGDDGGSGAGDDDSNNDDDTGNNDDQTGGNDDPQAVANACQAVDVGYGRRQVRLLQRSEYENSVFDLTGVEVDAGAAGVPADTFVEGFVNQVLTAINQDYADAYSVLAEQIAAEAAANNFNGIVNCNGLSGEQCANRFVDEFAFKVYRRPLTQDERARYVGLFDSSLSQSNDEGLELAVEAAFGSVYFLMRFELGTRVSDIQNPTAEQQALDDDAYVLSPYEIATFLAYTYTGSTPDDTLLQEAASNRLTSQSDIESQIDRLLLTPQAREHFGEFAKQWLETERVVSVNRDAQLFPTFTTEVRAAMETEVVEIFRDVMFDGTQPLGDLYSDFSYINDDLAEFYGINGNFGSQFTRVDNLGNRGGILTSGAFMAGFSNEEETSPIRRAVFVREELMCMDIPPMPTDLEVFREDAAAALEQYIEDMGGAILNRDRFHFLTRDEPCAFCHDEFINPHGFGMEDFDPIGLVRTQDLNGLTIDESGELIGLTELNNFDEMEIFSGARGLSTVLQTLPVVQSCFVENGFRYVMGSGTREFESGISQVQLSQEQIASFECAASQASDAMDQMNQTPREAFRTFGSDDVVRFRK